MNISRNWLSDFVDWVETDPQVIADRITCGLGEVDDVVLQGKYLDGVVVGKVINLGKHPNADKLSVCDIETEQGIKHVVCGGTNLRDGMHVAFAHTGATVLAGGKEELTLAKVKIRGEESEGMICAAEEIELESMFPVKEDDGARPIADLTSKKLKVGTPLREALELDDVVFRIDNHAITNRPDLFSHIGVAREIVALGLASWKKEPTISPIKEPKEPVFVMQNDVPDLVTDYHGCLLDIDGEGETPEWMKRRLEATGWRSINLTVDITNYVLMEMGMPLHAFDADDFKGTPVIRAAKKGEKMTTLDDIERALPEGAVVISDDEGIFDLFGIMGGLRTSNKPTTKKIFLQAGVIRGTSVRKTILAMAHRTDAATVYEKGVSYKTAERGLARAVELFLTLHPKARVASKILSWGKEEIREPITIPVKNFSLITGADISPGVATIILRDLGFMREKGTKDITITVPWWRADISGEHDLIEEVARIYGYDKIPVTMPSASIAPPARDGRIHTVRDALKLRHCTELLHLAFTSPGALKKAGFDEQKAIKIENPIGEELSCMRPSLLPAMLETAGKETSKISVSHLKVFEYGHVFTAKDQPHEFVAIVAAKSATSLDGESLLILKSDLTCGWSACGYELTYKKSSGTLPSFAHTGRSADIICQGKKIGLLTEIEPETAKSFDLPSRTAIAILDLDAVFALPSETKIAQPLPMFPSIEFDETIPLSKTAYTDLYTKLKALSPLLTNISIVNLYEGKGTKTMTLRFVYRSSERTLTQDEVEKIHEKVLHELKE